MAFEKTHLTHCQAQNLSQKRVNLLLLLKNQLLGKEKQVNQPGNKNERLFLGLRNRQQ